MQIFFFWTLYAFPPKGKKYRCIICIAGICGAAYSDYKALPVRFPSLFSDIATKHPANWLYEGFHTLNARRSLTRTHAIGHQCTQNITITATGWVGRLGNHWQWSPALCSSVVVLGYKDHCWRRYKGSPSWYIIRGICTLEGIVPTRLIYTLPSEKCLGLVPVIACSGTVGYIWSTK